MENIVHDSIEAQRKRYDGEADHYDEHHNDRWSQSYRTRAIRDRLLDLDLNGKNVLDAMCASGIETAYLLDRGATVTGLDISDRNVELYRKKWRCPCSIASIHQSGFADASFDVVHIFGGLHHVLPILPETMREIHRILRPGGRLTFVEPNADTAINRVRTLWYAKDSRFTDEEEAISYRRHVEPYLALGFTPIKVFTGGNIGYLAACQSHILGTPAWLKKILTPPAYLIERLLARTPVLPHLWLAVAWQKL